MTQKTKQKQDLTSMEDKAHQDLKDLNHDAKHFVGHPLTLQDKQDEDSIMHDILQKVQYDNSMTPKGPQVSVTTPPKATDAEATAKTDEEHKLLDRRISRQRKMALSKMEKTQQSEKHQESKRKYEDMYHAKAPVQAEGSTLAEDEVQERASADEEAARRVIRVARTNSLAVHIKLKAAQAAVRQVDTSLPSAQQLLARAKKAQSDAEQELEQIRTHEQTQLQEIVKQVKDQYEHVSAKAANELKEVQDRAHRISVRLQRQAKTRTAAVIAKAKRSLEIKLNELTSTLTDSVDRRQRARAQLVALRSQHADEVQLAQHALNLAKVNKATHEANTNAREAAKRARTHAMHSIGFAKTILGSRLKAVRTTERLSVDKAQLRSHAMMTEAKEALSRTTQTVLMALDDADSSIPLEAILGKEAIIEAKEATTSKVGGDMAIQTSEFDEEVEPSDVGSLNDEELIGSHAAMLSHAAADTVYTSKMHRCKFPFMYNGEKFFHCKESIHGSWCATDVDEKIAVKRWDYCVQNQRAVFLAKQAAMEAAKLEIKRVLAATGAEISPDALRESLQAAAAAQAAPAHTVDNKAKPDEQDLESQTPVMGHIQAEHAVDELINHSAKSESH